MSMVVFLLAHFCCSQAILLFPWIGNPYNQLAVLAQYDSDHLTVFYFYMRALCCEAPFVTARENAAAAVERNRLRLAGGAKKIDTVVTGSELEETFLPTEVVCHSPQSRSQ